MNEHESIASDDKWDELIEKCEGYLPEMGELILSRSNYSIDHHVLGKLFTPGQQRQMVLVELAHRLDELHEWGDEIQEARIQIEIQKLQNEEGTGRIAELNQQRNAMALRKLERSIAFFMLKIQGCIRETEHLLDLLDKIPKITREEMEADEAEYGYKRSVFGALVNKYGARTGYTEYSLSSMVDAKSEPGEKVDKIGLLFQVIKELETLDLENSDNN